MPVFVLACLAYVSIALPPSVLGILWPSMRVSFHEPVGALGLMLPFAIAAEIMSSASTGRLLSRVGVGSLLAGGTVVSAAGLIVESLAPSLWVFAGAIALVGIGFGAIDSGLNTFAASHFGAREINWMHASYGLGAMIGPLLVTALLGNGVSWRWAYVTVALAQAVLASAFALTAKRWKSTPVRPPVADHPHAPSPVGSQRSHSGMVVISLVTFAVQAGIESGIGLWGYVFLTTGRGLPDRIAGLAVAGYWATMFAGRIILGPVAQRYGSSHVLTGAIACVVAGTALMTVPGSGVVAAAGMMIVGLAAAPVFPLLTLTTAQRVGEDDAARTIGYQGAASALGGAALSAGMALLIGGLYAGALAPSVLVLAMAMCAISTLSSRFGGRAGQERT